MYLVMCLKILQKIGIHGAYVYVSLNNKKKLRNE